MNIFKFTDVLLRCKDCSSKPSKPPLALICSKISISLVFYESVTDGPTDGPTDRLTDGRTDPLIEMRGRIQKM